MAWWRLIRTCEGKPIESREIGIFTSHPRYGWWHIPSATGAHEHVDFDVRYSIDEAGFRITPAAPPGAPEILCLGCSYTFGHGVRDHEAYPWVLGDKYWQGMKVHNAAVNAWGTAQMLLFTEDYLKSHKPALVIYGWIPRHAVRNSLGMEWLQMMAKYDRKSPYFELVNGELRYRGLRGLGDAITQLPPLGSAEKNLCARLLEGIAARCASQAVPFAVVLLPYMVVNPGVTQTMNQFTDEVVESLTQANVRCFDARGCIGALTYEQLYFRHDPHPIPIWHQLVARTIAQNVKIPSGQEASDR
jgi:hypothetical protein